MIDRESRDILADLLRQVSAGRIGKDAFQASLPRSKDKAVQEIIGQSWLLFDDLREHELAAPDRKDRPEVLRWILFLRTDLQYEWPSLPAWARILGFVPSILTFGLFWRPYRGWFERQGDWRVWPFVRDADFKAAKRNPAFQSAK
jgi:hypothetical protein